MTDLYWGAGTPFKNKVAFFTYIRGCLRQAWNRHPVKLSYLNKNRKKIPNPNPKGKVPTVWGFNCEVCRQQFVIKECQVDHITPCGTLREASDIQAFTEKLLFVTPDDLRLVCKRCNSALAYADKNKTTLDEAMITKSTISIMNNKKDKEFFTERSIPIPSNATKRRAEIIRLLTEEANDNS